jgi:hypothetical protein
LRWNPPRPSAHSHCGPPVPASRTGPPRGSCESRPSRRRRRRRVDLLLGRRGRRPSRRRASRLRSRRRLCGRRTRRRSPWNRLCTRKKDGGKSGKVSGQHRIEVCIDGCVEDVRLEDGEKSCSFSQPNKHGNAKLLSEFRVSDESDARKRARDARRDACMRPCAREPDGRPIGGPSTGASRRDRGRYRAMTWATRVAPRVGERHRVLFGCG